jgi:hypothetical protein
VAARGINVELSPHARLLEAQVEFSEAFRDIGTIIKGTGEKRGRRFLIGNDLA